MTLIDRIIQITSEFPPHTHRELLALLFTQPIE
jgi:hypothetical protein